MEIIHFNKDEIKSVILRNLDYVALVMVIDKKRNLIDEYLDQSTFGDLDFKYWMFVLETCVLNMKDVVKELRATGANKQTVRSQLLGMIVTLSPHVYDEDRGWD